MKRYLGIMVMALVILMPRVDAKITDLSYKCGDKDTDGNITCTVSGKFDTSTDTLKVTLTEQGGAKVIQSSIASADVDWSIDQSSLPTSTNGVWTINLTSIGVSGEATLFKFSYTPSGTENCRVLIGADDLTKPVTPVTPSNPKTGSSLPYIALASITVLAGGAYIATKNKSKMYRL